MYVAPVLWRKRRKRPSRTPEFVLGFLFATAIGVVILIFAADPQTYHQICEPNQYTGKESCAPHNVPYVIVRYLGHWFNEASAVIAAFATVAIAWLTITLAGVGRQQIDDTRILQRAHISVEPGGIKPFEGRGADDRVACNIIINNAGNLPASKLSWVIERAFSMDAYRKDFPITRDEGGNIILAPKVAAIKGADSVQTSEFDDAAEGSEPDRAWLYIWGRVSYHDGFRGDRWTQFCHRYNLRGATEYMIPKDNGRYHEHGNRTDES